jgi:hypothetical protein
MKKCRFNDPSDVAAYFDGAMERGVEEEFGRHLLACRECAGALLNLERDLFLMTTVEFARHPRKLFRTRARFRLGRGGLDLRNPAEGTAAGGFVPFALSPVRGGEGAQRGYRLLKAGVTVDLKGERGDTVSLDVRGAAGRSVLLYRGGRLVEARSRVEEEQFTIDKLERGSYLLFIKECGAVDFTVD